MEKLMYRQAGADSLASLPLLEVAILITSVVSGFDLYLKFRQWRFYHHTEIPPAVLTVLDNLSERDAAALEQKIQDKAPIADVSEHSRSHHGRLELVEGLKASFDKAQSYGLHKANVGILSHLVDIVISLAFLVHGVLPFFYDAGRTVVSSINESSIMSALNSSTGGWIPILPVNETVVSLAFVAIYALVSMLLGLPWSLYSTFVVENKHGFNKQTLGSFFQDVVLEMMLGAVVGLPVIAGIIQVVHWGGDHFYLYASCFLVVIQLFMMILYPNFIAPLFNKFEPLPEGTLRTKIFALAAREKFPLTNLYLMDGSRRSGHSNAYFYGFGSHKRIVLYDTLVKQASEDEIVAVLAHEIGHWAMGHTVAMMGVSMLMQFSMLLGFSFFIHSSEMYSAFGFVERPVLVGLLLFNQLAFEPLGPMITFGTSAISRRFEYQADAHAAALGYSALLQTALVKLQLENLGALVVDAWYSAYKYSHPPLTDRLSALQKIAAGSKSKAA